MIYFSTQTNMNTCGSLLVCQLAADFLVVFLVGQVVNLLFCGLFVLNTCLLRLEVMLMRAVRGNQNSGGCKMLKSLWRPWRNSTFI